MAKVADVEILLRAQVGTLQRDLALAQSKLSGFARNTERDFGGLSGAINKAFAGITPTRVIGGLTAIGVALGVATKKALDFGSEIVDTSRNLGLSTNALQELRFAASQSGVEVGALDTALKFLNKNASEAASGNARAAEGFRRLGVDIKDSSGQLRDVDELFTEVIQRIGELESPAERTAVSMQLLGRSGSELGKLATEGAEGIDNLRQQARDLGLVIDGETLVAAEKAGDQFDALFSLLKIQGVEAILEFSDELNSVAGLLLTAAKNAQAFFDQFRDPTNRRSIEGMSEGIDTLRIQLENLQRQKASLDQGFFSKGGGLDSILTGTESDPAKVQAAIDLVQKQLDELEQRRAERTVAAAEPGRGARAPGSTTLLPATDPKAAATAQKIAAAAAKDEAAAERLLQSLREDRLRAEGKIIELIMERARVQEEEIRSATLSEEQRAQALRDLAITTDAQVRAAVDAQDALDKDKDKVSEIGDEFADLGRTVASVFATMVTEGEFSFQALGKALIREVVEKGVIIAAKAIEGLFSTLGTASAAGTNGGFLSLFGLASGGIVTRPTLAMVGESGPEAVIPLSQLGGGRGGDLEVIINNNAGAQVTARQARSGNGRRSLLIEIEAGLSDSVAAGGQLGRTMEKKWGLNRRGERNG